MKKVLEPQILDKIFEKKIGEYNQIEESANKAIDKLLDMGIPTKLEELKPIIADFDKFIQDAENQFLKTKSFIPTAEKDRIHKSYTDIIQNTEQERSNLRLMFSQSFTIHQQPNGHLYFDSEELKNDVQAKSTYQFTEKDTEYFNLLKGFELAFQKLNEFEQVNGYLPYSQLTMPDDIVRDLRVGYSVKEYAFRLNMDMGFRAKK